MKKTTQAGRARFSQAESNGWGDGGNCPDCNVKVGEYHVEGCDIETCEHCGQQRIGCDCHDTPTTDDTITPARPFGIFQEIFDRPGTVPDDNETDYACAIFDLQSVIQRISVMAEHASDLVEANTPEGIRALSMLREIDLLTKDGMSRIQQLGIEF